jgi:hypothetical protein
MSQTQILLSGMTVRSRCLSSDALPILIEVPRLGAVGRKNRVRHTEPAHQGEWRPSMGHRRPRRRLRRHVRLSACAFLGLAPLASAACFAWSGHASAANPARAVASEKSPLTRVCLLEPGYEDGLLDRGPTAPLGPGHGALLSIEAASPAPSPEAVDSVTLPGYLLPDNSREEPSHEGS